MERLVYTCADKLKSEFGLTVEVKYIDTTKEGLNKYPELKKITDAGYSFPITTVNGEARLAGDIVYENIKELIQETLAE